MFELRMCIYDYFHCLEVLPNRLSPLNSCASAISKCEFTSCCWLYSETTERRDSALSVTEVITEVISSRLNFLKVQITSFIRGGQVNTYANVTQQGFKEPAFYCHQSLSFSHWEFISFASLLSKFFHFPRLSGSPSAAKLHGAA